MKGRGKGAGREVGRVRKGEEGEEESGGQCKEGRGKGKGRAIGNGSIIQVKMNLIQVD